MYQSGTAASHANIHELAIEPGFNAMAYGQARVLTRLSPEAA